MHNLAACMTLAAVRTPLFLVLGLDCAHATAINITLLFMLALHF